MANTRIKDLANQATTIANDDYILLDGAVNGTRRINKAALVADVIGNVPAVDTSTLLVASNNLSDLTDVEAARVALNVPTTGTGLDDVPTWGDLPYLPEVGTGANQVPLNGMLNIPVAGNGAFEVPVNSMLGELAYLNASGLSSSGVVVEESGTWTPVFYHSNVNPSNVLNLDSTTVGKYVRHGELVYISCYISMATGQSPSSAYDLLVSGLPYEPAHGSGSLGALSFKANTAVTAESTPTTKNLGGGFFYIDLNIDWSDLSNPTANGFGFTMSGVYQIA